MVVSAAAGTRQPELRYRMSDVTVCDVIPTAGFAGAGTWGLTAFVGAVPGSGGTTAFNTQVGLPAIWLPPGTTFGPVTRFLDVADQWSAINLLLEECYADDTQLSEAHLEREQEERALAEHSPAILIGG